MRTSSPLRIRKRHSDARAWWQLINVKAVDVWGEDTGGQHNVPGPYRGQRGVDRYLSTVT